MTSSNRNIFGVTGHFTGRRWIPLTKASDADLRCLLWSVPEQTVDRDAGDLRRHRAHYDSTVMTMFYLCHKIGTGLRYQSKQTRRQKYLM